MSKVERRNFGDIDMGYTLVGLDTSPAAISEPVAWRIAQDIHPLDDELSDIDTIARIRERVGQLDPNSLSYIETPRDAKITEAQEYLIAKDALDYVRRMASYDVKRLSYEYQLEELLIELGEISTDTSPKLMKATKNEYERRKILEFWSERAQAEPNEGNERMVTHLRSDHYKARQQREYIAWSEFNQ